MIENCVSCVSSAALFHVIWVTILQNDSKGTSTLPAVSWTSLVSLLENRLKGTWPVDNPRTRSPEDYILFMLPAQNSMQISQSSLITLTND